MADDDKAFREALQGLPEPEFNVVASVGDGQALIEAAQALGPDLIITDLSMPVLSGLRAVRQWKSVHPDARVIFLTVNEEPAFVAEAEKAGALGYVFKRYATSDLIPAIHEALQGRSFVSSAALK